MKSSVQTAVLPELTPRQVVEKLSAHGYDAVEWRVHPDYHIAPGELVARAGDIRVLVDRQASLLRLRLQILTQVNAGLRRTQPAC
jgi:hypothetical protein